MLYFIDYIYFFYGLAFFLFGYSILYYPSENSIFKFAHDLKYLGIFGILHGISEWLVLFQRLDMSVSNGIPVTAVFITMGISYIFLLYFASRVLWGHARARLILFIVILGVPFIQLSVTTHSYLDANILVRYILGIPGIFLTSYIS